MRRFTTAAALLAGLALAVTGSAVGKKPDEPPGQAKKPVTNIQLVTVSDWHGQIVPNDVFGEGLIGGAAILKPYFDQAVAENPNTLFFMAGDSIGATPPISSFFEDEPAIQAMNMMGITADTFGNHNFDRGVEHLQRMVDLAEFDFIASNLDNLEANLSGVETLKIYDVGGVKVGVIGIVNEEAPELVTPGSLGTLEITDSIEAANMGAIAARGAGADVVVVLTHKGVRGLNPDGTPFGELIDLAEGVAAGQIDVIVGDHTDFQYSDVHQDRILVVENRSKGLTFAKVQLAVDGKGKVVSRSASFHVPRADAVTPDPEIQAFIDDLNAQLAPILGTVIGSSNREVFRSDSCGRADGRLCESLVGNIVTDALRTTYGTDFAITNSGGLRAALTCPAAGTGGFCPTVTTTPPFPITRGSVLGVLPFGNVSATAMLSGAEIKAFLENGVSAMPGANGRFPQVSGLCFTYDVTAAVGSRVTSIVRQAADGTCTTEVVMPGNTYMLATNDFMAAGGDGYPVIIAKATTRNIMDADVADYVTANSPLSPSIQGRINCTGATCPAITAP
jgi:2',3'-cyclic-nucleotide 2'-phosphodiesterase (5'-nucleotidase family)